MQLCIGSDGREGEVGNGSVDTGRPSAPRATWCDGGCRAAAALSLGDTLLSKHIFRVRYVEVLSVNIWVLSVFLRDNRTSNCKNRGRASLNNFQRIIISVEL